jgi:hypothetical protein
METSEDEEVPGVKLSVASVMVVIVMIFDSPSGRL